MVLQLVFEPPQTVYRSIPIAVTVPVTVATFSKRTISEVALAVKVNHTSSLVAVVLQLVFVWVAPTVVADTGVLHEVAFGCGVKETGVAFMPVQLSLAGGAMVVVKQNAFETQLAGALPAQSLGTTIHLYCVDGLRLDKRVYDVVDTVAINVLGVELQVASASR